MVVIPKRVVLSQIRVSPKCRVLDGDNVVFLINCVVTPVYGVRELQMSDDSSIWIEKRVNY